MVKASFSAFNLGQQWCTSWVIMATFLAPSTKTSRFTSTISISPPRTFFSTQTYQISTCSHSCTSTLVLSLLITTRSSCSERLQATVPSCTTAPLRSQTSTPSSSVISGWLIRDIRQYGGSGGTYLAARYLIIGKTQAASRLSIMRMGISLITKLS